MSSARDTALRALWGTGEFLDTTRSLHWRSLEDFAAADTSTHRHRQIGGFPAGFLVRLAVDTDNIVLLYEVALPKGIG